MQSRRGIIQRTSDKWSFARLVRETMSFGAEFEAEHFRADAPTLKRIHMVKFRFALVCAKLFALISNWVGCLCVLKIVRPGRNDSSPKNENREWKKKNTTTKDYTWLIQFRLLLFARAARAGDREGERGRRNQDIKGKDERAKNSGSTRQLMLSA